KNGELIQASPNNAARFSRSSRKPALSPLESGAFRGAVSLLSRGTCDILRVLRPARAGGAIWHSATRAARRWNPAASFVQSAEQPYPPPQSLPPLLRHQHKATRSK